MNPAQTSMGASGHLTEPLDSLMWVGLGLSRAGATTFSTGISLDSLLFSRWRPECHPLHLDLTMQLATYVKVLLALKTPQKHLSQSLGLNK